MELLGEIIAVASGKGGTGKTSVCAAVATALADAGERVLCLDCDVGLRNLDISLGLSDLEAISFLEVCRGDYDLRQAVTHPAFASLSFLTAPVSCHAGQIEPEAFSAMVRRARRDFDYIFLDAPAGVDAGLELVCAPADRVLLVTGADPAAVRDAGRTGQVLQQLGKDQVKLIINRVRPKMVASMALTLDDVMDGAGLPLLGVVPEDENVVLAVAFGKPLLRYRHRSGAAAACKRIAKRIQGMYVPLPVK